MQKICDLIIGHDEHEPIVAESLRGAKFRVTRRDNDIYGITDDMSFNRINLVIMEGIITEAYIG